MSERSGEGGCAAARRSATTLRGASPLAAAVLLVAGSLLSMPALAAPTANPHGERIGDCTACHTAESWSPLAEKPSFRHDKTGFSLTGAHAGVACLDCHRSLRFSFVGTACADCHEDLHRGELGQQCQGCHDTSSWTSRAPFVSAHAATLFPLLASHAQVECDSCHVGQRPGQFKLTPVECMACHMDSFRAAKDPDHVAAGFPEDCVQCHGQLPTSWQGASFAHAAFPLHGAHARAACESCHESGGFNGVPTSCIGCHRADYEGTRDPDHRRAGFSTDCQGCHSTERWDSSVFDHAASGFPLDGAHSRVDCASCHPNGFTGTSAACFSCHQRDYQGTTNPNHAAAGFSTRCESCHTTTTWQGGAFDHATSSFPLDGAHARAECASCHAQGYASTSSECFSCHRADYQSAKNPDHVASRFSTNCRSCHNTSRWQGAAFDHASTAFPLTGAHTQVECASCHRQGYAGTSRECYSCHRADYQSAKDPDHVASHFATTCQTCHSTNDWRGGAFDHATSGFPLTGAHAQVDCASCHRQGYTGTSPECYACHRSDYESARNPNHVSAGIPTACQTCHTTARWQGASFDHSRTRFPLQGAHTTVECATCHRNGYSGTSAECYSCHRADFDGARDPNHAAAGFPTSCQTCHSQNGWQPASFDHSRSRFPLQGAHVTVACATCHRSGYTGTPAECYSCHRADYDGASDPNHAAAGFPTTCQTCHSQNGWQPASFDHSRSRFPLTGAHVQVACASCHRTSYTGTPTQCYSCHRADYDGTRDPNHAAAGFPTTCESCHTTARWSGATFDHEAWFPIASGHHRGFQCTDCHTTPSSFAVFSCTSCHEHNRSETDSHHREVSGYSYDSQACYGCHPRGRE